METPVRAKARLILSVCIFGTIGLFVRAIPLASSVIACVRGLVGMVFLLLLARLQKQALSGGLRANLPLLCLSGAAIGGNWLLLFEAYRYTTVATATLCYYLAPTFVILASPLMFHERLTPKKAICAGVALVGMVCVSGFVDGALPGRQELLGVLCGLGAAMLYATVIIFNKKTAGVSDLGRTVVQLGVAGLVMLPYALLTQGFSSLTLSPKTLILLLIVSVVHTGVAYALYFGAIGSLSAQTVAVFSYLDPVVAVLLSALLLGEHMTLAGGLGAVLILAGALISELPEKGPKAPTGG